MDNNYISTNDYFGLQSNLDSARSEIQRLQQQLSEKEMEIEELKKTIEVQQNLIAELKSYMGKPKI